MVFLLICIFQHWPCSQIQKGASGARSDDTKSLKSAVLDWITPRGQPLSPPLGRNVKSDRGFHHERTGALLCPTGLDWANAEWVHSFILCEPINGTQGPRKSSVVVNWQCLGTNGRFFSTMDTPTIQMTHGMVCSAVHFLSPCVCADISLDAQH